MKSIFVSLFVLLFVQQAFAEKYFICYDADKNPKLHLSVCFENNKAVYVKYQGQDKSIPLTFVKTNIQKGVAAYSDVYSEKYRGKVTGTYVMTHSGNYDYVKYTRKKDGKVFNFTINHTETISEEGNYRTTPCY